VQRDVSINVADDYRAFLKLEQRGTGRRSYQDGDPATIGIDIPKPDESVAEGVNSDAVYRFGSDASGTEKGLFSIANQGTRPVKIYSEQQTIAGVPSVTLYDVETGKELLKDSPSDPLGVGEDPLLCGIEIDTRGVDVRQSDYEVDLVISATAVSQ
jgi:hypothetical protein